MGRKPTSTEVLEARGSWVAAARKKALTAKPAAVAAKRVPDWLNPTAKVRLGEATKARLEAVCRSGIPNYDPWATAAPGEWFDHSAAYLAIRFFEKGLVHVEGSFADQPFLLGDWQKAIVGNLFGWKRKNGSRRYRKALLYIPRGNGKTPIEAGVALKLQFADGERGAQIYLVASSGEQAALAYRHASGMVHANPELDSRAKVFKANNFRSVQCNADALSVTRVIPSDAGVAHGFNPHAVFGDELHCWEKFDMLEAIETAFRKKGRRQPLLMWTTTADFDRPSPCNEVYEEAKAVLSGTRPDSSFLPVIYEAPEGSDWTDESTWEAANPNMDVTVDRDEIRKAVREAIAKPYKQLGFKRMHLNIRTTSQSIGIPLEQWDACRREIDWDAYAGKPCYAGLDVSSRRDLTAFVQLFPGEDGAPAAMRAYSWIPGDNINDRGNRDKVSYQGWIDGGWLMATSGNVIDEATLEAFIRAANEKNRIIQMGFDAWNAQGMCQRLGTEGVECVETPQTITRMTEGSKFLAYGIASQTIIHDGNPVARWMVTCLEFEHDKNDNMRPVKPDRTTGKHVDILTAAVMACGRMAVKVNTISVYESRGVLYF